MKITQRIIGAILGLSLAGGVATGVFLSPQNNDIEPTHAETNEVASNVIHTYLEDQINWSKDNAIIKLEATYSDGTIKKEATTSYGKNGNNPIFYAKVETTNLSKIRFLRTSPTTGDTWNYSSDYTYNSSNSVDSVIFYQYEWNVSSNVEYGNKKIYLLGSHNNWEKTDASLMSFNKFNAITKQEEYFFKNVLLTAGGEFKINQPANDGWYGSEHASLHTGVSSTFFTINNSGNDNIKVNDDGTGNYDIYFKITNNTTWETVIQESELTAAQKFASSFLKETTTVCEIKDFSTHESGLSDIWTNIKNTFDALSLGAMETFKTNNEIEEIISARERYIYIIDKYTSLTDFAKLRTVNNSNLLRSMTGNNNAVLITIATLISSAAVVSYSFLKIRRKKEY